MNNQASAQNQSWYSRLLDTLRQVIKSNKRDSVTKLPVSKTISQSNWRRIPNAAQFGIHLGRYSNLWQKILGILRRTSSSVKIVKGKNRPMNRYIEHQINRLRKLKGNPNAYFRLSFFLMKNSTSFRVSAIHAVLPLWYRKQSLSQVKSINTKCTKIINKMQQDIREAIGIYPLFNPMKATRVYIEKANPGEWRPLGVPQPQWRLFLHMFSNFLYIFLENNFLDSQHGFIPGRGTLTAWKHFFDKEIYNYKYIYEIDLEKCFDKINHIYMGMKLAEKKVPREIRDMIIRINKSSPKLPDNEKTVEDRHKWTIMQQYASHLANIFNKSPVNWQDPKYRDFAWSQLVLFNPQLGVDSAKRFMRSLTDKEYFKESKEELEWLITEFTSEGVAQGTATGPILAAFTLIEFFSQENSLSYADDGLFYSNQPLDIKSMEKAGIVINEAKSGYVKYNGVWQKPLKYLGLQFDGSNLEARTRKGSTLKLSKDIASSLLAIDKLESSEILEYEKDWQKLTDNVNSSWIGLMKSKHLGFIMSRLYNGDWNLERLDQDFRLTFKKGSWTDIYPSKHLIRWEEIKIQNISTFASNSLSEILSGRTGLVNFNDYLEITPTTNKDQKIQNKLAKAYNKSRKKYFAIRAYYKTYH